MKSKASLWVLFILFIGLLALVLLTNSEQRLPIKVSGEKIVSFVSKTEIDRVRFIGKLGSFDISKTSLFKEKSPFLSRSDWVLREPLFAPVDEEAVEKLLQLILDFSGEKMAADKIDPSKFSDYGIEPPSIVLILNKGDFKEAYSLGVVNDITKRFFVKKESDKSVYLVDDLFLKGLQEVLSKIRSDKVLSFDYTKIRQVDVLRPDLFYRLMSDCAQTPKWTVTSDALDLKADSPFVMRELKELSEIRVRRIYDNPYDILQFTGLATPLLVFKLVFSSNVENMQCGVSGESTPQDELIFQIGKGVGITDKNLRGGLDSTYYLKIVGENVIYEIDKATIGDWMQSVDHFRSKAPLADIQMTDFQHVEAIVPSLKCSIASESSKVPSLSSLVSELEKLEFDMFVQLSELGNFEKAQGISFFLKHTSCATGFESVGLISQQSVTGEKVPTATVLKIKTCKEPEVYGVMSLTNFKSVADSVTKLCN